MPPQLPPPNLQKCGMCVGGKRIEQAEPFRHQFFLTIAVLGCGGEILETFSFFLGERGTDKRISELHGTDVGGGVGREEEAKIAHERSLKCNQNISLTSFLYLEKLRSSNA